MTFSNNDNPWILKEKIYNKNGTLIYDIEYNQNSLLTPEIILELDNNTNVNSTISNKKIIIKILNYKISSVNKSSEIAEFITKYNNDYKFIIVEAINSKSEKILLSYQTDFEIFKFTELMICIVEHILVPKHMILSQDESNQVLQEYCARKRDMPFIMSNDPVARFYNMKPGEICKIIRPSILTCDVPFYRIVIKTNNCMF